MGNEWIWDQWDFLRKSIFWVALISHIYQAIGLPTYMVVVINKNAWRGFMGTFKRGCCTICVHAVCHCFRFVALVEHNAQNRFGGSGDMFLPRLCVCFCVCWVPGVGGRQRPGRGGQQSPALEGAKGRWECSGLGTSGWPFDWAWGGGDRLICLAVSWEPLGQVLGPPASPSQLWALSWSGPSRTVRAMDPKSKVWCPVELDARPSMKGSKSKSI